MGCRQVGAGLSAVHRTEESVVLDGFAIFFYHACLPMAVDIKRTATPFVSKTPAATTVWLPYVELLPIFWHPYGQPFGITPLRTPTFTLTTKTESAGHVDAVTTVFAVKFYRASPASWTQPSAMVCRSVAYIAIVTGVKGTVTVSFAFSSHLDIVAFSYTSLFRKPMFASSIEATYPVVWNERLSFLASTLDRYLPVRVSLREEWSSTNRTTVRLGAKITSRACSGVPVAKLLPTLVDRVDSQLSCSLLTG